MNPAVAPTTLGTALARLDALIDWERLERRQGWRQSLDPVRDLLARVGDPWRAYRVVHVAGTKGKGSVASLVAAGLERAGLATGCYASPHVERVQERVRLRGAEVDDALLAEGLERALAAREAALAQGSPARDASWFDLFTAAALWIFARACVEWAVVEVGLGGRLDSTNVVEPELCVVTTIDLEHTAVLGTTRAAIAREKGGILKPGAAFASGVRPDPARGPQEDAGAALAECAARVGVPMRVLPPAPGIRGHNLALARLALDLLGERGHAGADGRRLGAHLIDAESARRAALPGRLERFQARVPVVLDGAHVASSVAASLDELAREPGLCARPQLVLALAREKDVDAFLKALAGRVDTVRCTSVEGGRHREPEELAALARQAGILAEAAPTPRAALDRAIDATAPTGWVLATGSLYLAGALRPGLRAVGEQARPPGC